MNLLLATRFIGKFVLPGIASASLLFSRGFSAPQVGTARLQDRAVPTIVSEYRSGYGNPDQQTITSSTSLRALVQGGETASIPGLDAARVASSLVSPGFQPDEPFSDYAFGNPAGCSSVAPVDLSLDAMLASVRADLGASYNIEENRSIYIWNGPLNTMLDVSSDKFVYEFSVDAYKPPFTYQADQLATVLLNNGFVVWFRSYGGHFRLLAVPMIPGVFESAWGEYVKAYWQVDGVLADDTVQPTTRKLPCHWVIEAGWVTDQGLLQLFDLNWTMPDYLSAGRKFLASTCKEANQISQQEIGYWDASSMCGPLAWRILKDANSFPYRMGNWFSNADLFTQANPRWNGRPWLGFDPETYDLISIEEPMMGYDFAGKGHLYTGDIVYSYSTLYQVNDGRFDHIFVVAGINADDSRVSITNVVQNSPHADCSIREITLYAPGDPQTGFINHEWNNHGFGSTGSTGFEVLRWKWVTYHLNGEPIQYTVRWGDTLETIAFDWKVSPQSIRDANQFTGESQLAPGQVITLPAP